MDMKMNKCLCRLDRAKVIFKTALYWAAGAFITCFTIFAMAALGFTLAAMFRMFG